MAPMSNDQLVAWLMEDIQRTRLAALAASIPVEDGRVQFGKELERHLDEVPPMFSAAQRVRLEGR